MGLDVTSSSKEVLRRYKEIINRLKISDYPSYELDIQLPENFRNEASVNDALRELQSPKDNISAYFFWFQISNTNDKRALGYIVKNEFTDAIKLWKSLADSESSTSFIYKKNLALLYCLLLLNEDNSRYLKDSLALWKEIVKSEKFWKMFSQNYGEQNEQTVSEENINTFRNIVIKEISNIYTDLSKSHKRPNYVKDFQETFGTYGEGTEKTVLQPTYKVINDKVDEIKKIIITRDDPDAEKKIEDIEALIDFIKIYLNKLRRNGLYDTSESKVVRDHIAEVIRAKTIDIHNNAELYEDASRLIKIAASISGTESYASSLENDKKQIENTIKVDKTAMVSVNVRGFF